MINRRTTLLLAAVSIALISIALLVPYFSARQSTNTSGPDHRTELPGRLASSQAVSTPLPSCPLSASGTNVSLTTQMPVGVNDLRRIADASMSKLNVDHVASQFIVGPHGATQAVSMIYEQREQEKPAQTLEDVLAETRQADANLIEAGRALHEARKLGDDETMRAAARAQVAASRALAGENRYYTVELSMTRELPPVLMFRKGLPAWIALQARSQRLAADALSSQVSLSSVIRLRPLSQEILAFTSESDKVAYVDIRSMSVHMQPPQASSTPRTQQTSDAGDTARIEAQWDAFLENGFDVSQFDLHSLTDLSKPMQEPSP